MCFYLAFYGPYTEHVVNITPAQQHDDAQIRADHGAQIRNEIRQTLNLQYPPFFFALILENQETTRTTFTLLGRHRLCTLSIFAVIFLVRILRQHIQTIAGVQF